VKANHQEQEHCAKNSLSASGASSAQHSLLPLGCISLIPPADIRRKAIAPSKIRRRIRPEIRAVQPQLRLLGQQRSRCFVLAIKTGVNSGSSSTGSMSSRILACAEIAEKAVPGMATPTLPRRKQKPAGEDGDDVDIVKDRENGQQQHPPSSAEKSRWR